MCLQSPWLSLCLDRLYIFLFSNRGLTFSPFHNVGCIRFEFCCSLVVHQILQFSGLWIYPSDLKCLFLSQQETGAQLISQSSTVSTHFLYSLDRSLLFINSCSQFQFVCFCNIKKCSQFHFAHCFPICARDRQPMAYLPETAQRHLLNGIQHPWVSTQF